MILFTSAEIGFFINEGMIFGLRYKKLCGYWLLRIFFRFLLSTNSDMYIKTVLHVVSIIASKCDSKVFTLPYLRNNLMDLVNPVAMEKVLIYIYFLICLHLLFSTPLTTAWTSSVSIHLLKAWTWETVSLGRWVLWPLI